MALLPALFVAGGPAWDAAAQSRPTLRFGNLPANNQRNIAEEDNPVEFRITVSSPYFNLTDALLDYAYLQVSGSAVRGIDYELDYFHPSSNTWASAASGFVQTHINASSAQKYVRVRLTPISDARVEPNRTLTIRLTSIPSSFGSDYAPYTVGSPNSVTFTIVNTDPTPVISFDEAASTVEEDDARLNLLVNINPAPQQAISVVYRLAGTALPGSDYDRPSQQGFRVPAGATTANIPININEDSRLEASETIILTLQAVQYKHSIGSQGTHTVTITDDDDGHLPIVTIRRAEGYTFEGEPAQFTVTADPAPTAPLPVQVNVNLGHRGNVFIDNAQKGLRTVTVPASGSATISIPTMDNDDPEDPATIALTVIRGSGVPTYRIGVRAMAKMDILTNNQGLRGVFPRASNALPEGGKQTYNIVWWKLVESGETARIDFTLGGTATLGEDYELRCGTTTGRLERAITCHDLDTTTPYLLIEGSSLSESQKHWTYRGAPFSLFIFPDDEDEGDETVRFDAPTYRGSPHVTTINNAPETAAVSFTRTSYTVQENDGEFQPVIRVTPALGQDFALPLIYRDGSATWGVDYTGPNSPLVSAGTALASTDIPIIDDTVYEGDETFIVAIDAEALPEYVTLGSPSEVTITIEENDPAGANLLLSRGSVTVAEGGSATYTARLATEPASDVTLNIASDNADVAVDPSSLTFTMSGAGIWSTPQTVTVNAAEDDADMAHDTATLTHTATGYGTGTWGLGVTVPDNDVAAPAVNFASDAATASETAPTHNIPVTLSAAAANPVTVTYSIGGTAVAGNDYASLNGRVAVAAGVTSAVIPIALTDDMFAEFSETIILTLTAGDGYTLGTTTVYTLTITDDDRMTTVASFATDASTAQESDGTVNVAIDFSPTSGEDITVTYMVGGSAAADADYAALTGTIDVAARSASVDIPVAITDDSETESSETVILTLTGGAGYDVGTINIHTLTIADNDATCLATDTAITEVIADASKTAERTALAGDCTTLRSLKAALEGTTSLNWSDDLSMSDWHGNLIISQNAGRVTAISFGNADPELDGTIPPALADLDALETLNLAERALTGTIPPELGGLANLTSLGLNQNQLEGQIPATFNQLTQLTDLDLNRNQLSGNIPDLSNLTNLTSLNLYGNQLTGPMPAYLNTFPNLELLWLHQNQLDGTIPDLSNLTALTRLYLSDNQFTGFAASSPLTGLTSLEHLLLDQNRLSGNLPDLSANTSLAWLYLHQNQFSGALPTTLGDLASLEHLLLAGNDFTGGIPAEIGSLTSLAQISLCGAGIDDDATLPAALETRRTDGQLAVWSCVRIEDDAAVEGAALSFAVEHDTYPVRGVADATDGLTLSYATGDGTATSADYTSATTGSVVVPANANVATSTSSAVITVSTTDDAADEPNETLTVTLDGFPASGVHPLRRTATGTITDNDVDDGGGGGGGDGGGGGGDASQVTLSVSPNPVIEGKAITVTATLSQSVASAVTIPLVLTAGAAEEDDYGALASVVIAANEPNGTGAIATVKDDDTDDETFTVALGALPAGLAAGSPASVEVTIMEDTSTSAEDEIPAAFALEQNYPNPFNPVTTIEFALPRTQRVTLSVYDMLGRQVRLLVDGVQPAARYRIPFDARDLASGTYIYVLQTEEQTAVKTMALLK